MHRPPEFVSLWGVGHASQTHFLGGNFTLTTAELSGRMSSPRPIPFWARLSDNESHCKVVGRPVLGVSNFLCEGNAPRLRHGTIGAKFALDRKFDGELMLALEASFLMVRAGTRLRFQVDKVLLCSGGL